MMRQEHSALFDIFFLFIFVDVYSQFIPPAKIDAFVYKHGRINSDTIVIDAFLDPVCLYSRGTHGQLLNMPYNTTVVTLDSWSISFHYRQQFTLIMIILNSS